MQVFAEEPHNLHAEVGMYAEEFQETLLRDKSHGGVIFGFGGHPVGLTGHALAQTQNRTGPSNFQKLGTAVTAG
jgi:hypothetical protein